MVKCEGELGRRPDARIELALVFVPRRWAYAKIERKEAPATRVSLIGVCSGTRFWLAFEIRVIARLSTYGGKNRDIPVMASRITGVCLRRCLSRAFSPGQRWGSFILGIRDV